MKPRKLIAILSVTVVAYFLSLAAALPFAPWGWPLFLLPYLWSLPFAAVVVRVGMLRAIEAAPVRAFAIALLFTPTVVPLVPPYLFFLVPIWVVGVTAVGAPILAPLGLPILLSWSLIYGLMPRQPATAPVTPALKAGMCR